MQHFADDGFGLGAHGMRDGIYARMSRTPDPLVAWGLYSRVHREPEVSA
jgi:hypothetical protein